MTKAWAATWVAILAIGVASCHAPKASAVPGLCEHRSAAHAAHHHLTREADSRWHVRHGELPTCGLEDHHEHHEEHHDDGPHIPHRDHRGFHCHHFHCG